MSYVKMCKQCVKTAKDDIHNGYYEFISNDVYICPICNSKLIDTILTRDEYLVIVKVSSEHSFIEEMAKLKNDNPIEYQLKLNQFKLQQEQFDAIREQERESNKLHCPTCNSTKVKKISGTAKVAGAAMFGLFSKTARSQFKCENCGYKW